MLQAKSGGRLHGEAALVTAFMAPRLQGEHHPDGWLELSLWGAGRLGRLLSRAHAGAYVYGPNGFSGTGGGLHVAQTAPALALTGTAFRRFSPAERCAPWSSVAPPAPVLRDGAAWSVELGWACVLIEPRGPDLVVAAGVDRAEAGRGLALSVAAIVAEGAAYAAACDRMPQADPLLRSLVLQGTHAALSSARRGADGRFAGLAAGPAYSSPSRTYYRDAYWTTPLLLQVAPELVRAELALLATGVHVDGEAPSAVVFGAPPGWEALRVVLGTVHARPAEWWSDHFDSPLFFVLMLADYVAVTGDRSPVDDHAEVVRAIFERYFALGQAGGGLPCKPRHDRDWADNVYRSGAVAYDLGLWIGAACAVARLYPPLAERAREAAAAARAALDAALWTGTHYAEYAALDGHVERRLALDSLTLLRFDAVPQDRADAVLDRAAESLQTDWGMRCGAPPYARRADLRSKTAFPQRYHNGGDWPWLDGLYAGELLRRGRPGWRGPLTRWWAYGLTRGWTSPVEWFSPAYGRGGLLQAWSSLPAAVALSYREKV